jgi:NADH-ubiquinone oxidoreductase chain 4L
MLISIEILLLAIAFLILSSSVSFDDILGQVFVIYIISTAGAETAIGLGIFVAFYRLRGTVAIDSDTIIIKKEISNEKSRYESKNK